MAKQIKKIMSTFLISVLLIGVLPIVALAEGEGASFVARIGNTEYATLEEAVTAAVSGDTIELGEGKFTLYTKGAKTKDKNLTFVGQGVDKTAWGIGATVPDPANFGTEYNGDYSFDGAGTITFKNMTLQSGSADYLGFIRADKTVVDNCTINGKTFYWGYSSADFINTTFNCPAGDYAIWTYSSPVMIFDHCTFNSSGKVINVYTDAGAGSHDITVNFSNCTVNNTGHSFFSKNVLNINDSNMGSYKYIINISGDNTINGDLFRDSVTCSRLFGFGRKANTNNTGRSIVTIDDDVAFKDGKIVDHELNEKYTDGYVDNAYTITNGDWEEISAGNFKRLVKKVCQYCGDSKEYNEEGFSVTYTDGVDGEEIFADQTTIVPSGEDTPRFDETTISRPDYKFAGWDQPVTDKVTQRVVYTALWEKVEAPKKPTPTPEGPGDDGGPFTKDECGNVFDRWGNKIYEAKGCNVKGYKLVQTSVID